MNKEIFRAYDIRGVYPSEIDENAAYIIGQSYGSYLQEKYNYKKCIVSHDNRLSSDTLTSSLIKGIVSSGCDVYNMGLSTTPMNYYARSLYKVPGIMVTASHNPKDDNGFKFSFDGSVNARGEMISDFADYTLAGKFITGEAREFRINIKNIYINSLLEKINPLKKLKVVFDPGNGASSFIVKEVFDKVCDAIYINDTLDGSFPNHHPDPAVRENLKMLSDKVIETGADFGIAYDGDADRIGIVDDKGNMLPIEYFMILVINSIDNNVDNHTYLYDIKCSKSIEDYVNSIGATGICYRTGASYTEYKVQSDNLPFGCEFSGHVYFNDKERECCSALYASLRFIELMSNYDISLSEIIKDFPKYYSSDEIKIPSDDKTKFEVTNKVLEYANNKGLSVNDIDGARITLKNGWALVRASNTGPNIIFRCEGVTPEDKDKIYNEYYNLITSLNKEMIK